ncbi:MAG: gliding motility protein GldN [Bacteroidales bacterium]|nr:gliding motility protein GldN [Bacteroidales bacterium]
MKKFISLLAMAMFATVSFAQDDASEVEQSPFKGVDNVAKKEHIANKKGIPYVHVREADVMWSKTIWRIIDMREKMNHPLYYPTQPQLDGRRSMVRVMLDAISHGELTAYDAQIGIGHEFERRLDYAAVQSKMGAGIDTVEVRNPDTGLYERQVVTSEMDVTLAKKLLVKEVWFFDKKYSRMDVRIIGICPILEKESEDGERVDQMLGFWVYFPELRPHLMVQEAYNTKNEMQRDSFDDLFAKRRFGSYVYSEANVYDNRTILEFAQGVTDTNLEAERIKSVLFQKEHDVWEY